MVTVKNIFYKLTWEIRQKVMWPAKPIEYVKLSDDPGGIHYGLFKDEELISIVSLFISGTDAQFRKFATVEKEQGKGYGTILLKYMMTNLDQKKIKRLWCNARTDKAPFYERFGLRQSNNRFSRGGIDYVIMEKILNE